MTPADPAPSVCCVSAPPVSHLRGCVGRKSGLDTGNRIGSHGTRRSTAGTSTAALPGWWPQNCGTTCKTEGCLAAACPRPASCVLLLRWPGCMGWSGAPQSSLLGQCLRRRHTSPAGAGQPRAARICAGGRGARVRKMTGATGAEEGFSGSTAGHRGRCHEACALERGRRLESSCCQLAGGQRLTFGTGAPAAIAACRGAARIAAAAPPPGPRSVPAPAGLQQRRKGQGGWVPAPRQRLHRRTAPVQPPPAQTPTPLPPSPLRPSPVTVSLAQVGSCGSTLPHPSFSCASHTVRLALGLADRS